MSAHISTKTILAHVLTAPAASVDGDVYKTISADSEFLMIGPVKFPLNYFDIGGMNRDSMVLMDTDNKWHNVMLLGKDGQKLDHPNWEIEAYEPAKIRNHHLNSRS
jgi:hypothetical protein